MNSQEPRNPAGPTAQCISLIHPTTIITGHLAVNIHPIVEQLQQLHDLEPHFKTRILLHPLALFIGFREYEIGGPPITVGHTATASGLDMLYQAPDRIEWTVACSMGTFEELLAVRREVVV